jgi:hypothetical protein
MPLTYAGVVDAEGPARYRRQQARKIKPQYARGELRQVATASHQAEAELIQMLLLEEGIPSTAKRTTWDVPEMLAAGPRAVMVPESGYAVALEVLQRSELDVLREREQVAASRPAPRVLLVWVVGAAIVVALLILVLRVLV